VQTIVTSDVLLCFTGLLNAGRMHGLPSEKSSTWEFRSTCCCACHTHKHSGGGTRSSRRLHRSGRAKIQRTQDQPNQGRRCKGLGSSISPPAGPVCASALCTPHRSAPGEEEAPPSQWRGSKCLQSFVKPHHKGFIRFRSTHSANL